MNWAQLLGGNKRQYDLEQLRAMEGRNIRIRYGKGETGWAKKLEGNRAVVTNVPLEPDLMPYDVVILKKVSDDLPNIARVEWRAFDRKTGIKYPKPYQENYKKIAKALRDVGLVAEGFTGGSMGVAHGNEVDLQEVLQDAGIKTDNLVFRDDW